jgi:hypothetical protein
MLQTVEAIYHPQNGLTFSEAINITEPMRVLVTFVEQSQFFAPSKGSAQALFASLKAHPLPESAQVSDADIDAQIQDIAQSWES